MCACTQGGQLVGESCWWQNVEASRRKNIDIGQRDLDFTLLNLNLNQRKNEEKEEKENKYFTFKICRLIDIQKTME